MAGLELYLDATGMQRGAEAAKKALTDVEQGAKKTTESLDKVVTNVNKTGQALGGGSGGGAAPAQGGATSAGTGLAARISGVSGALSGLQSAANQTTLGGFAFQVGKLYDDFQQLKGGIDGGVTGFQALKAVMRAHPIFTITTIISAAAGAFGLLNSAMGETAGKYDELARSIQRAKLDEQAANLFGLATQSAQMAQMRSITSNFTELLGTGDFNVSSLTAATGRSTMDVAEYMWNQTRDPRYLSFMMGQEFGTGRFTESNQRGRTEVMTRRPEELRFTRDQAAGFARQEYERIGATASLGQIGPTGGRSMGGEMYGPEPSNYDPLQGQLERQRRTEEAAQAAREDMERLVQLGEAFGDRVGDAFYNIASGTQSARQALAAMISEFARMASRQAFSGLFGSIAGGFGATPAQGFQGPPTSAGLAPGPVQ